MNDHTVEAPPVGIFQAQHQSLIDERDAAIAARKRAEEALRDLGSRCYDWSGFMVQVYIAEYFGVTVSEIRMWEAGA